MEKIWNVRFPDILGVFFFPGYIYPIDIWEGPDYYIKTI